MPRLAEPTPMLHQLRFVFLHTAPRLYFVADVTAGDVAELWSRIAERHAESPVSVGVSLAPARSAGMLPALVD